MHALNKLNQSMYCCYDTEMRDISKKNTIFCDEISNIERVLIAIFEMIPFLSALCMFDDAHNMTVSLTLNFSMILL